MNSQRDKIWVISDLALVLQESFGGKMLGVNDGATKKIRSAEVRGRDAESVGERHSYPEDNVPIREHCDVDGVLAV